MSRENILYWKKFILESEVGKSKGVLRKLRIWYWTRKLELMTDGEIYAMYEALIGC